MIVRLRHAVRVFALVFVIVVFFVIGPLAVFAGADSRIDDVSRRRLGR